MHCGSAIVTMGDAVTTVASDIAMSVRILYIDVFLIRHSSVGSAGDC